MKLTIALDGEQALAMLADEQFKLDLIILDLNLPMLSGFDFLERNPHKDIPVVIFSASRHPSDVERTLFGSERVRPQADGYGGRPERGARDGPQLGYAGSRRQWGGHGVIWESESQLTVEPKDTLTRASSALVPSRRRGTPRETGWRLFWPPQAAAGRIGLGRLDTLACAATPGSPVPAPRIQGGKTAGDLLRMTATG